MIEPCGVEVMLDSGKWIPVEETLYGESWHGPIARAVERFHELNDGSDFGGVLAIEKMREDGMDDANWNNVLDYLQMNRGLGAPWWEFLIGTFHEVIVFATEEGYCKSTSVADFEKIQRNGKKAITLRGQDSLIATKLASKMMFDSEHEVATILGLYKAGIKEGLIEEKELDSLHNLIDEFSDFVFLTTSKGIAVKFPVHELKVSGRGTMGVRGLKLKGDDKIVGFDVVTNDDDILLVTENGIGKKVKVSDFRTMKRGAVGVRCLNVNEKTGPVKAAFAVKNENDNMFFLTERGQIIRMNNRQIPIYKRQAQGVRTVSMKENDKLISGGVLDERLLEG